MGHTMIGAGAEVGHHHEPFHSRPGGGNPARTYAVDRDAAIRVVDAAARSGVKRSSWGTP
ncbi:hypothetical protein MAHJHV45_47340 [Mycobacterium avium subsp. hominissuis]